MLVGRADHTVASGVAGERVVRTFGCGGFVRHRSLASSDTAGARVGAADVGLRRHRSRARQVSGCPLPCGLGQTVGVGAGQVVDHHSVRVKP
ncbi:hypothetical protein ACFPM0_31825 [Pseudonocardia sulfidoxydans]|uniref:hypothetical protein n=1 Tax=Pseudonocardia sulfidoxydans TaxID=54011 RepID=UPI003612F33C